MYSPYFNHEGSYAIGDILKVETSDYLAYLLIEDLDEYSYYFRNLSSGEISRESIWYLDTHKSVMKVA